MNEPEMTFENAASMGLSEDEWKLILNASHGRQTAVNLGFSRQCGQNIARINHQKNG